MVGGVEVGGAAVVRDDLQHVDLKKNQSDNW